MKLTYVHDGPLYGFGNRYVCPGNQFTQQYFERYAELFKSIFFVTRVVALSQARPQMQHPSVDQGTLPEWVNVCGVEYFGLNSPGVVPSLLKLRAARALLADRIAQCDAVILRLPSLLGLLAAIECRRLRRSYGAEVVGCVWDGLWNYGSLRACLTAGPMFVATRWAVRGAACVLYVTREFLQRRYPSTTVPFIASNVTLGPADPSVLAARLKRIGPVQSGRCIWLGTIGQLHHRYKGLDTAIRALSLVRRQTGIDVRYRVLGPGDPAKLYAIAEREGLVKEIFFDGVLRERAAVMAWLDQLDIYLQPSRQEGLPRALVEAMSRALPIVASTAGGIPELLAPEWLHRPGDWRQLANAVMRLLDDPTIMRITARRNFERAGQFTPTALSVERSNFFRCVAAA